MILSGWLDGRVGKSSKSCAESDGTVLEHASENLSTTLEVCSSPFLSPLPGTFLPRLPPPSLFLLLLLLLRLGVATVARIEELDFRVSLALSAWPLLAETVPPVWTEVERLARTEGSAPCVSLLPGVPSSELPEAPKDRLSLGFRYVLKLRLSEECEAFLSCADLTDEVLDLYEVSCASLLVGLADWIKLHTKENFESPLPLLFPDFLK